MMIFADNKRWLLVKVFMTLVTHCLAQQSINNVFCASNKEFEIILKNFANALSVQPSCGASPVCSNSSIVRRVLYNDQLKILSEKHVDLSIKSILFYTILKAHTLFYLNTIEANNVKKRDSSSIERCSKMTFLYIFFCCRIDPVLSKSEHIKEINSLIQTVSHNAYEYSILLQEQTSILKLLKTIARSIEFKIMTPSFPLIKNNQKLMKDNLVIALAAIKKMASNSIVGYLFGTIAIPTHANVNDSVLLSKEWNDFFMSMKEFCLKEIPNFSNNSSCQITWKSFVDHVVQKINHYRDTSIEYPLRQAQRIINHLNPTIFDLYKTSCSWFLQDPSTQKKYKGVINVCAGLMDLSKF